jgi:MoaA/NifB/PqqE/SkfB family radical SAM enzyme
MKDKIKGFMFNRPWMLEAAKRFFSNKYVANSSIYKYLVMEKAEKKAGENSVGKHTIFIENTLSCNSRCIFCAHHYKTMTGTMTMDLYRKIIDDCRVCGISSVVFGVYGETFVDKYLFERIEYLRKYDMTYGIITNASLMTPDITEKLFQMGGLSFVHFSANGFSKEVYEKTMVGLKRDVSYRHMLYFLKRKKELKADKLVVNVSTVITKYNKKDIKSFFKYWRKKKGINMIMPTELFDRMGIEYKGEIGELGPLTNKNNWLSPCRSVWGTLMIYYDGKAAPCCQDADERYLTVGDANKQTIEEILNSEELKSLQKCHLSGNRRKHPICGKCYLNNAWLGQ